MSVLADLMNQNAIRWERESADARGRATFKQGVAITCRWEDHDEEFLSPGGERRQASARAFVSEDVAPGDRIALGDLESSTDATPTDEALEVLRFSKITAALLDTTPCRTAFLGTPGGG